MGSGVAESRTALLGRDQELLHVRELLDAVTGGLGRVLLITGEAGIGKTRLLKGALGLAGDRFHMVFQAASELEAELPFAPLIRGLGLRPGASDVSCAEVASLLTRTDVADPGLLRLQVIEAIADLVEGWAIERPVLIALDDLHWADDATLQSLDLLGRRLRHVGVFVVGTLRPHPQGPTLQALLRTFTDLDATVVDLAPLPDDVVSELVRQNVAAEVGPRLGHAISQAGGNPLYVQELLASAGAQSGHIVDLPAGEMPSSVRQAIVSNLSSLPESTLDVLRLASVLGRRFDLRQLALTLARSEPDVIELLRPALTSGVLSGSGGLLEFRHDLVREAVYQEQPEAVRAASHRHVVERLRAARVRIEDLVPHLLRGRWTSVPEAAQWLADAGSGMRTRNLRVAGQLLARSLDVIGDDLEPDVRLEYAEILAADNRFDEMAAVLHPLLSAPPEMLSTDARDRLVKFAAPTMLPTLNASARRELLDTLEDAGLSEAGRLRAVGIRAQMHWSEGRLDEAEELATRALAADTADAALASQLHVLLARLAEGRGQAEAKLAHSRRALALAEREPDQPELALSAASTLAIMLGTDPSKRSEADQVVARAQSLADRTGLQFYQVVLESVAALNADRRGAWEEAAARYEGAIGSIGDIALVPASGAQVYARAARLHLHRNDLTLAIDRLRTAQEVASRAHRADEKPDELLFVHLAEAEVAAATGDDAGARAALVAFRSFADARGIGMYKVIMLPAMTAVATELDDSELRRGLVEDAEQWVSATHQSGFHLDGILRWCRASVDGDHAALDRLVSWCDGPTAFWEWKPQIREDAARVYTAAGRRDDAVLQLQGALVLWDGVQARRDVARTRAALRNLGVRVGRGEPADRPSTGWASITDAEWRVLEFVREGLIYREIGERLFISRRTVETHIQHVFHKLGVSSRADLTHLLNSSAEAQHQVTARR